MDNFVHYTITGVSGHTVKHKGREGVFVNALLKIFLPPPVYMVPTIDI